MQNDDLIQKVNDLFPFIQKRIVGQNHVIQKITASLERGMLGLAPQGRPRASFLFLGPTGVGKTEITLAFSEYIFGKDKTFRFDMSEYQHADSIKNLIGDESDIHGRLGDILLQHNEGVLLFDEVEKAHRLILDLFLQMLDAARITTGRATLHDLSHFFIVMTSNIGGLDIMRAENLPFTTLERSVLAKCGREFRPELLARFTDKFVFKKLSYEAQRDIALMTLSKELDRFASLGHRIVHSHDSLEFLIRHGFDKINGARPMRNCVERFVGNAILSAVKSRTSTCGTLSVCNKTRSLVIVPEIVTVSKRSTQKISL